MISNDSAFIAAVDASAWSHNSRLQAQVTSHGGIITTYYHHFYVAVTGGIPWYAPFSETYFITHLPSWGCQGTHRKPSCSHAQPVFVQILSVKNPKNKPPELHGIAPRAHSPLSRSAPGAMGTPVLEELSWPWGGRRKKHPIYFGHVNCCTCSTMTKYSE